WRSLLGGLPTRGKNQQQFSRRTMMYTGATTKTLGGVSSNGEGGMGRCAGTLSRAVLPWTNICARRVSSVTLSGFILLTWTATAADSKLADAAEKSDRAAMRTLLKRRTEVNASQADGMTALHWAAYNDDFETAKLLLKAGADAKATNRYGVTALSMACVNGN